MATQQQLDKVYMQNAVNMSTLSYAVRKKVGCILVTPENLQIGSYNGQPSGWDNICEQPEYALYTELGKEPEIIPTGETKTLNTVIHAELNTILHAARQGVSIKGSTIYISLSPCIACSAMIAQAGIKRVVYQEEYRDTSGIDLLRKHGIIIEKLIDNN